jgi:hypothetical protein
MIPQEEKYYNTHKIKPNRFKSKSKKVQIKLRRKRKSYPQIFLQTRVHSPSRSRTLTAGSLSAVLSHGLSVSQACVIEEREGEMGVGETEKRGRERKMKRGEGKQGGVRIRKVERKKKIGERERSRGGVREK